ncbi:CheA signal transduction histidine kinase [Candidatus Magnetobacterium bavaricum]|uniref:CheA signal transduction histidine kinase n=1 Tax=Candidatus Magnetobacterium bavaricum TaxID=29290 RepID=A0A0F3GNC7_9BACT|nr:CheA signal transduction histidine kinase [Candidatus Magnetobacterium bavaricum]
MASRLTLMTLVVLGEATFDLVVADVAMPRLNGLELTQRMRADKRHADVPVVLVTGMESPEDKRRGIEVGASAYIVKSSFDQNNLLEVIKRFTG